MARMRAFSPRPARNPEVLHRSSRWVSKRRDQNFTAGLGDPDSFDMPLAIIRIRRPFVSRTASPASFDDCRLAFK